MQLPIGRIALTREDSHNLSFLEQGYNNKDKKITFSAKLKKGTGLVHDLKLVDFCAAVVYTPLPLNGGSIFPIRVTHCTGLEKKVLFSTADNHYSCLVNEN